MPAAHLRLLKVLGESRFWKAAGKVHTSVYRLTGGKVGHKAGKVTNLLLTTVGRKSGATRTVPLAYLADGDRFVVVASNGGSDRHPAWWLNLQHDPRATAQIGGDTINVHASLATAVERARLWPQLKAVNPFYGQYEKITAREIPVVILRRV